MRLTELVTPLKPLEAMAQGQLFIASDVGGHRELIRDGETGVLFRAGDAADLTAKTLELFAHLNAGRRLKRMAGALSNKNELGEIAWGGIGRFTRP